MRIVRTCCMALLVSASLVHAGEGKSNGTKPAEAGAATAPSRLLPVKVLGKHGLIDTAGQVVLEPEYDAVHEQPSEGLWGVEKDGEWGFVDKSGEMIVKKRFTDVLPFCEGLAAVQHKETWGFIDKTGTVAIEPAFAKAYSFQGQWARAAIPAEADAGRGVQLFQFGFIDRKGAWAIEPAFAFVDAFAENRALVNKGGKWAWGRRLFGGAWGFIDRQGEVVIEAVYDKAHPFSEGLAAVRKEGLWGYVDLNGKEVIAPAFAKVKSFQDGLAVVRAKGKKTGMIDKTGAFVVAPDYDAILPFAHGTAVMRKGLLYGVIDRTGKVLRKPDITEMGAWSEGLVGVRLDRGGPWGVMNRQGKLVVEPTYTWVGQFSKGLARVSKGGTVGPGSHRPRYRTGKWGYLDKTGAVAIPLHFTAGTDFVDGYAVVAGHKGGRKWNGIDRTGEAVSGVFDAHHPTMLPGGIVKLIGYHRRRLGYYSLKEDKMIWKPQQ